MPTNTVQNIYLLLRHATQNTALAVDPALVLFGMALIVIGQFVQASQVGCCFVWVVVGRLVGWLVSNLVFGKNQSYEQQSVSSR